MREDHECKGNIKKESLSRRGWKEKEEGEDKLMGGDAEQHGKKEIKVTESHSDTGMARRELKGT